MSGPQAVPAIDANACKAETDVDKHEIIKILVEARSLIEQGGWSQFCIARDRTGNVVDAHAGEACRFCLSGALCKAWRALDPANEDFYFRYFEEVFSAVLRVRYGYDRTFTQWNDHVATSQKEVVVLIDRVIAHVEEREAVVAQESLVVRAAPAARLRRGRRLPA